MHKIISIITVNILQCIIFIYLAIIRDWHLENINSYIEAPEYKIVPFGKDISLECTVAIGQPKKHIFWTKIEGVTTNKTLKIIPSIQVDNTNSLNIRNVKTKDIGRYSCNLITQNGHLWKQNTIILSILKEKPKIWGLGPRSKSARNGQTVHFRCMVKGYPSPTITWSRDDIPIDSKNEDLMSNRYIATSYVNSMSLMVGSLKINQVQHIDKGKFTCSAKNHQGIDAGYFPKIFPSLISFCLLS